MNLDLTSFEDRFRGLEDIAEQIVAEFLDEMPLILSTLEKSIAQKNGPELKICAHTLKGIVGNFFAENLRDLAYSLEKMGANNDFTSAFATFQLLEAEMKNLQNDLIEWQTSKG